MGGKDGWIVGYNRGNDTHIQRITGWRTQGDIDAGTDIIEQAGVGGI